MVKPLEYVADIKPYVPGKPLEELERELGIKGSIKLASNENPLGPSPKALKAMREFLDPGKEVGRYPDGSGFYLKQALSERLAQGIPAGRERGAPVRPEELILGNGSNELLDVAVRTYMGPGDEAVMATPSFVVYSMSVRAIGGKPIEVPLTQYTHDLARMADAITERTKIVFIATPNNPTGTMNKRYEFEQFIQRVPKGMLIVLDEAYYEYVMDPEYPNILTDYMDRGDFLVLRTFSKAFGLAGLRIGYGIAKKEIITEMDKIRAPFNTSSLAQIAALAALDDEEHLRKTIEVNEEGKRFLYHEFEAAGIQYVPTEANFIYMPLEREARPLYDALLRKGVIVRPMGPKEIRVSIGLPEENKRFIETFKESVIVS